MAASSGLGLEKGKDEESNLEWILVRERLDKEKPEGLREKMVRRTKENPFVPIGSFLTACALTYGVWCMRTGDSKKSQLMMRARVLAQGFTIVALVGGIGIGIMKQYVGGNKKP